MKLMSIYICRIVFCLLAATGGGCSQHEISGEIFIASESKEPSKLSLVDVHLVRTEVLNQAMDVARRKTLSPDGESAELVGKIIAARKEIERLRNLPILTLDDRVQIDILGGRIPNWEYEFRRTFAKELGAALQVETTVTSDSDGRFKLLIPSATGFSVVAATERKTLVQRDFLLWATPVEAETLSLNNRNLFDFSSLQAAAEATAPK